MAAVAPCPTTRVTTPTNKSEPWWEVVQGSQLAQGDYLTDCVVPMMPAHFAASEATREGTVVQFDAEIFDLIVLTQSCDLEQGKAPFVAAAPIVTLDEFERTNPTFKKDWESVRKGRREGFHLLASIRDPLENREALVVDFRQIHSLPVGYLTTHAARLGKRRRLRSPYLEHFSQSFARFFMRVGLPCAIPPYK